MVQKVVSKKRCFAAKGGGGGGGLGESVGRAVSSCLLLSRLLRRLSYLEGKSAQV